MKEKLITYVRAGYAGLFVVSAEEARAEGVIKEVADELNRKLFAWSLTEGMVNTASGAVREAYDPVQALEETDIMDENQMVIFRDFQLLLDEGDPVLIRKLRDNLRRAKTSGKTLILLGCRSVIPPELNREITVVDFTLPTKEELDPVLNGIVQSAELQAPSPENQNHILEAASGLTTTEAENAFALSIIERGNVLAEVVAREKANTLKQGGILEVVDCPITLDDIGGLDVLKEWLFQRREVFTPRAREYGLPLPKGLLILGVPGTGKSLTAKATASVFGVPLLKLDAGKLFGSLVGQSEANLRQAIQTSEAISPCVLWIDELEKGFGGGATSGLSGITDGGTSSRVFGSLLNWLQEKTSAVFVVATANAISQLPPELLRKGRWDELWFVDLPNQRERTAIWDIVIEKYGRQKTNYDTVCLARASELYTGAEIEAVFVEALHLAFTEDREPTELDLGKVLNAVIPLTLSMPEAIERTRHWARGRARHASHDDRPQNGKRKLDLS